MPHALLSRRAPGAYHPPTPSRNLDASPRASWAADARARAGGASARRGRGSADHRFFGAARTDAPAIAEPLPPDAPLDQKAPPYDYFSHWYPIAFADDIDKEAPYRFVLLGVPLVVWWEPGTASWRVFKDVCPHRLVPLSEGRVNARGQLECAYHGWAWSGSGRCEAIPQGAPCTSPRACAVAYPCAVRQGLLFVKPQALPNPRGAADVAGAAADEAGAAADEAGAAADEAGDATGAIPTVAELDQEGWVSVDGWRDLPYDWSTLLENTLDASHVPFTHHKSISNRNVVGDYDTSLTEPVSPIGFAGIWHTGPRAGALGPQSGLFKPPCYMQQKIEGADKRGVDSMVVVYAVPMEPGRCRLINRNAVRFTRTRLPAAVISRLPKVLGHIGTQVPLEDDQIFLHLGEVEYAAQRAAGATLGQTYYMPSQADTYVTAFRRWLDRWGGGGPWGPITPEYLRRLPPRQTRDQLLDRYSQHTAHCATCQRALKRLRSARAALQTAAALAAGLALFAAAVAVAVATFGGAAAAPAAAASAPPGAARLLEGVMAAAVRAGQALAGVNAGGAGGGGSAAAAAAVVRAAVWAALAAAGGALDGVLAGLERKFRTGDYPPMRNLDKS